MRKGTIPDALPSSSAILKRPASCWFDRRQCRDTRTRRRTSCRLAVAWSFWRRPSRSSPPHPPARKTNPLWSPPPRRRRTPACSHILPLFKAKTGIDVKVVAQGTGQALDTGRRGDADVLFVHAKAQEEKFVADGFGVKRYPGMYNDFVLIGPKSDPAGIKGMTDVAEALKTIKSKGAPFISRGDRSGTHIAELDLWRAAGIDIGKEKGPWY